MNTVAVFKWEDELPSDEQVGADPANRYSADFGEQWAYQACQPVATAVLQAFRSLGHRTNVDTPYFGENGWHFTVELEHKSYSIMVLWIPKGNDNDYFAVQPSLRRGCIASLFLPWVPETALRSVCAVLQQALAGHPMVTNLEWVREI